MIEKTFDKEKLNRYFNNNNSENDSSSIYELFCDKKYEKDLELYLLKQFDQLIASDEAENHNIDHILHRIHFNINTADAIKKKNRLVGILTWTSRIAAVILLPIALFCGIRGYNLSQDKAETWIEIKAPAWTRAQFSLPDGTTGWLNSNSGIKYNGTFIIDRQVTLTGEAFFDVTRDTSRPFRVYTNDIVVKVLGTRFNIASYENENSLEVVLEEGKIEFSDVEKNNSYIMVPNDLVLFDKINRISKVEQVETKKYLSWTEGKLVFRNDPIDVIARRLERWYNIDIEVDGSLSEDLRLRATFIDEGLEEVLSILKRSLPIDYTIQNPDIKPDYSYAKKKVILSLKNK